MLVIICEGYEQQHVKPQPSPWVTLRTRTAEEVLLEGREGEI